MSKKPLNRHPILTRFIVFILLPAMLIFAAVYWKVSQSIAIYSGQVELPGLTAPVQVNFDAQGTPSVVAKTDADAYFMQGYLHASERMWQMELQRRTVQGRLSEILGESQFDVDVWMRTLGLRSLAEKSWEQLSDSARLSLSAYADGVNAWVAQAQTLPPEFLALDVKPEKWEPIDSLAWQKVFALTLGLNMNREMERLRTLRLIPPEQLNVFFPHDPEPQKAYTSLLQPDAKESKQNETLLASNVHTQDSLASVLSHLKSTLGVGLPSIGSNAWAVSGRYTDSGNAILANDPHLPIVQELPWYSMQLKGDKLDATGMSFIGLPGVIMGRNRDIAWGTTSLMSDQQDLFYLNAQVTDSNQFVIEQDGETKQLPIDVEVETFNVKRPSPEWLNKEILPVKIEIRRTPIGPVVSDAVRAPEDIVVLRWAALDEHDVTYEAFHSIQYANNWETFRQALSLFKAPGLHFIYADNQGNIGSQVVGKMPIRGEGMGLIPLRLNNANQLWQGYAPFEQLPSIYNPPSGIVIAANAKMPTNGLVISHAWAADARKIRIQHLLDELVNSNTPMTLAHMNDIQNDNEDLDSKILLPLLADKTVAESIIEIAEEKEDRDLARDALAKLASWDGVYSTDSIGSTIYEAWVNNLRVSIFNNELNPTWNKSDIPVDFINAILESQVAKVLSEEKYYQYWCSKKNDNSKLPCRAELINSFYASIEELEKQMNSDDVDDWQWSENHHLRLQNPVFSTIMEMPFTKEVPTGGALNTVNLSLWIDSPSGGYQKRLGASFRQIFDLGKREANGRTVGEKNTYVIPTGQSTHFLADHFNDQTAAYIAGENYFYAPVHTQQDVQGDDTQSAQDSSSTLMFLPKMGE